MKQVAEGVPDTWHLVLMLLLRLEELEVSVVVAEAAQTKMLQVQVAEGQFFSTTRGLNYGFNY
jgi:hypothetical protein